MVQVLRPARGRRGNDPRYSWPMVLCASCNFGLEEESVDGFSWTDGMGLEKFLALLHLAMVRNVSCIGGVWGV